MPKKTKPAFDRAGLVAGTLRSLLEVINGMEGLEREYMADVMRGQLYNYIDYIGALKEFEDAEQLAALDVVFSAAGWDNQGLRWETQHGLFGLYIVELPKQ